MSLPAGAPLEIEQSVFAASGLTPEDFRKAGRDGAKGARRPLRVKPTDIELAGGVDEHGAHITIAFTLPAGSFATVLLQELMKTPPMPAGGEEREQASEAASDEETGTVEDAGLDDEHMVEPSADSAGE